MVREFGADPIFENVCRISTTMSGVLGIVLWLTEYACCKYCSNNQLCISFLEQEEARKQFPPEHKGMVPEVLDGLDIQQFDYWTYLTLCVY